MDRNSDDYRNRMKFIAIGAGALVLALIVFSSLSWCAIMACGRQLASIPVGFWELLGGTSVAALAVLFIKPLRNRVLPRQLRSDSTVTPPVATVPAIPVMETPAVETPDEQPRQESNWRAMYEQLSDDERRMFKSIMKKYCDDSPAADVPTRPGASSGTE